MEVAVRAVSPRTVTDMAKAMAERAADSQRTARRALPRRGPGGLLGTPSSRFFVDRIWRWLPWKSRTWSGVDGGVRLTSARVDLDKLKHVPPGLSQVGHALACRGERSSPITLRSIVIRVH